MIDEGWRPRLGRRRVGDRLKRARLIQLLIKAGWSPPRPGDRVTHAILDDIERISGTGARLDLAPREIEVVRLAGEGYTIPESADAMGVSHWQAQDYWARARRRLGAKTQAHAVAIVARQNLLFEEDVAA